MNGRMKYNDNTPEGRLAALASAVGQIMDRKFRASAAGPEHPDFADFREAFRTPLRREVVLGQLAKLTDLVKELERELFELDKQIKAEGIQP
jgi:hypothetical protein